MGIAAARGLQVVRKRVVARADNFFIGVGWFFINSEPDLFVGQDSGIIYKCGMRFLGIDVPRGARIRGAWIDYTAFSAFAGTTVNSILVGEDADDATQVVSEADYNGRTQTSRSVDWDSVGAWTAEAEYRSPDIGPIIQEIIERPGWRAGNAVNIFHEDNGSSNAYRNPYSYDGAAAKAPRLTIDYEYAPRMAAVITIHEDSPPHRMLAELPTAHAIDRLFTVSGRGRFSFSVVNTDAGASRDTVREGRVVVIWSTTGLPPYVGFIQRVEEDPASRTLEISGDNLAAILYDRQLDLASEYGNQAAGSIAMQLLRLANSTNPMPIWPFTASEPGSSIRGTISLGSATFGAALDELAAKTGDEWWLEQVVTRRKIETFLRWGRKRGSDKSRSIQLQEGIHLTDMRYARDALGYARSVVAVGGGAEVADRPAAVRVAAAPSGYTGKATIIASASEEYARSRSLSPLLAREIIEFLPLDEDEAVLGDAAQRVLEQPLTEAESFDLTVNDVLNWGEIAPGDVVRVILHSAYFGGVNRRVRILAMQPDEDAGELDLAVEVKQDA